MFANGTFLKSVGYTHELVGGAAISASYRWLNASIFPEGSPAEQWRLQQVEKFNASLQQYKSAGLKVWASVRRQTLAALSTACC